MPTETENQREFPGGLSCREWEIARYAAKGRSNAEIATHFTLAISTVKAHLRMIYGKLNVRNRTELAYFVVSYEYSQRIVPPDDDESEGDG